MLDIFDFLLIHYYYYFISVYFSCVCDLPLFSYPRIRIHRTRLRRIQIVI